MLLDVLVFRVTLSYLYRLWIYKIRNTELVIFATKIASYMFLDCAHLSFYSDLRMYYFFVRFGFTNGMVDFLLMQSAQKSRLMFFFLFAYLGTHTLDTELCKLIRKKKKDLLKNGQRFGMIQRLIALAIYTKWFVFDSRRHMNSDCFLLHFE